MAMFRPTVGAAYTATQARAVERGPGLPSAAAHGRSLPTFTGEASATPVGHLTATTDMDGTVVVAPDDHQCPHSAASTRMEA
jgi:hypothetical protein